MPRTIILDADVIGAINRGNARAAMALKKLIDNGTNVYISHQAYNELTHQPGKKISGVGPDNAQTAVANKRLLDDLRIVRAPTGTLAERMPVYDRNIEKKTLQDTDMMTAAQARAISAEVWSFDRAFRNDPCGAEQRFGIVVAPETQGTYYKPGAREDYLLARSLLGLKEIEVTVSGHVIENSGDGGPSENSGGSTSNPPPNPNGS